MIATRLQRIARENPAAIAVISGDREFTYPELLQAGAGLQCLLERFGTRPGDVVIASLPTSLEAVATFVACVDRGAIFLPINPAWGAAELSWLAGRITPAAVIVKSDDTERWLSGGFRPERLLPLKPGLWPAENVEGRFQDWPENHPALYLVTSGSTGRPKIVPRSQGGVLAGAAAAAEASRIGPGNRLLTTVPFYHASGSANNLGVPLLSGATLVLLERFDPAAGATLIQRHSIDYLWSSPVAYGLLLDAQTPATALRSLRVCLSGGAPLAAAVKKEWRRRYGIPIREFYGTTETSIATMQFEDSDDPAYMGRPIRGAEIRILANDVPQPSGSTGEVALRGSCMMAGYVGEEKESGSRFWEGYFRTGDLGWQDESGNLYVAGRIRPWINTGGVKVDPLEVQLVLRQIPGIRNCKVGPEPGPRGMDVVAAAIELEPGASMTRAEVVQHCRKHMAEFKIPRVVRFTSALAGDLTGKTPEKWS